MDNKLKRIEDISYYLGMIVSLVGIVLVYMSRRNLPEGACPVDDYRYILITGIILFLVSLIMGFVRGRREKKL